jgi:hypothetical protein
MYKDTGADTDAGGSVGVGVGGDVGVDGGVGGGGGVYKGASDTEGKDREDTDDAKPTYWECVQAYLNRNLTPLLIKLKIVITTYQIVSSIPSATQASFPSSFTNFLTGISVVNLNLGHSIPFGCSQNYNFIDKLVATTLFPIALTAVLILLYLIEHYCDKCTHSTPPSVPSLPSVHSAPPPSAPSASSVSSVPSNSPPMDMDMDINMGMGMDMDMGMEEGLSEIARKYIHYFFFLTYLVLPSVTTTLFQIFICTNVDPDRYSYVDIHI